MVIEQGKSSQLLSFSTSDMVLGFVHLPLKKKKNFFNELIEHWPFLVSCAKWETIQFGHYSLWLLSEFVCFVTTHFRSSASHFSTKDILLPPPHPPSSGSAFRTVHISDQVHCSSAEMDKYTCEA